MYCNSLGHFLLNCFANWSRSSAPTTSRMSCLHHSSFAIFHYQHFCLSKQANVLTEEQSRKYHASLAGLMTATLLFPLSGRSHRSEFVTLCCHCYQTPTGRRIWTHPSVRVSRSTVRRLTRRTTIVVNSFERCCVLYVATYRTDINIEFFQLDISCWSYFVARSLGLGFNTLRLCGKLMPRHLKPQYAIHMPLKFSSCNVRGMRNQCRGSVH